MERQVKRGGLIACLDRCLTGTGGFSKPAPCIAERASMPWLVPSAFSD